MRNIKMKIRANEGFYLHDSCQFRKILGFSSSSLEACYRCGFEDNAKSNDCIFLNGE